MEKEKIPHLYKCMLNFFSKKKIVIHEEKNKGRLAKISSRDFRIGKKDMRIILKEISKMKL